MKQKSMVIVLGGSFLMSIFLLVIGGLIFEKKLFYLFGFNLVTAFFIYFDTRNLCFQNNVSKRILIQKPKTLAVVCIFLGFIIYPIFLFYRNDYVTELVTLGHIQKTDDSFMSWLSRIFKSRTKEFAWSCSCLFLLLMSWVFYKAYKQKPIVDTFSLKNIHVGMSLDQLIAARGCSNNNLLNTFDDGDRELYNCEIKIGSISENKVLVTFVKNKMTNFTFFIDDHDVKEIIVFAVNDLGVYTSGPSQNEMRKLASDGGTVKYKWFESRLQVSVGVISFLSINNTNKLID